MNFNPKKQVVAIFGNTYNNLDQHVEGLVIGGFLKLGVPFWGSL